MTLSPALLPPSQHSTSSSLQPPLSQPPQLLPNLYLLKWYPMRLLLAWPEIRDGESLVEVGPAVVDYPNRKEDVHAKWGGS